MSNSEYKSVGNETIALLKAVQNAGINKQLHECGIMLVALHCELLYQQEKEKGKTGIQLEAMINEQVVLLQSMLSESVWATILKNHPDAVTVH